MSEQRNRGSKRNLKKLFAGLLPFLACLLLSAGLAQAEVITKDAPLDNRDYSYTKSKEDTHEFTVKITEKGAFSVTATITNRISGTLALELYDANGTQIYNSSTPTQGKPLSTTQALSEGAYRVVIAYQNSTYSFDGSYRIRFGFTPYKVETKEKDGSENPNLLAKGKKMIGATTISDPTEYFLIDVPSDKTEVTISVTSYGFKGTGALFYENGTSIKKWRIDGEKATLEGGINIPLTHTLDKGKYLVEMTNAGAGNFFSGGGTPGKYSISWSYKEPETESESETETETETGTETDPKPTPGTTIKVKNITYVVNNNKTVTVNKINTTNVKSTNITIPSKVTINNVSYPVTVIKKNAFSKNTKIKQVTIGANITKIENNAFYNCKNLKKITIKSKKITKIGKKAFKGIKAKAVIYVPASKYSKYKKLLKASGLGKSIKIKKK